MSAAADHQVIMNTVSVNLLQENIPEFLRSSPYLQSLIADEEFPAAGIEVPADCSKADMSVLNVSDLECLLKTVRFWLVPELLMDLEELHVFTLDPMHAADVIQTLNNFKTELPHANTLLLLVSGNFETKLIFAASRGFLSLLDFLCQTEKSLSHEDRIGDWDIIHAAAAKEGKLSCLQYFQANGCLFSDSVSCAAAANGHMDCLVYAISMCSSDSADIPTTDLLAAAAKGGQVAILKYLLETFRIPEEMHQQQIIWSFAARGGHLDTLKFLHAEKFDCDRRYALIAAAENGHVAALEYLTNTFGVPEQDVAQELWVKAATTGQLQVMKYLQECVFPETFSEPLGEPDESLLYAAIVPGGIPCIDYLRELGHPWHELFTQTAAENGYVDIFQFLIDRGCPCNTEHCSKYLAEVGSLEGLRFIFERGMAWSSDSCEAAASKGHMECFTFLLESGCPLNVHKICKSAATNLSWLVYVHHLGGKLTPAAAAEAGRAGALDCLQYMHTHGCVFTIEVANACASNVSPECLQFVLQSGCPVNEETCQHAAIRPPFGKWKNSPEHQLACLKLLHERGCPWDERTCIEAVNAMNVIVLQYAIEHGCSWGRETRSGAVYHCALYLESISNS